MKMALVRFLVLILTSLVLLLHNSCAHHQGRKLKANSLVAPAKMGLVHRDSPSGALGGNQHQEQDMNKNMRYGKTSEARTRDSSEKDERTVNNDEANDMNMMLHRDYSPQGKNKGRRKPPINNHNHKH